MQSTADPGTTQGSGTIPLYTVKNSLNIFQIFYNKKLPFLFPDFFNYLKNFGQRKNEDKIKP